MKYYFEDPVQMLVEHPKHGSVIVPAFCPFDARLQASSYWNISLEEMEGCKIGIKPADLQRAAE